MSLKISRLGFWLFWTDNKSVSFLSGRSLSPFGNPIHTLHSFLICLVCYLELIHYAAHRARSTLQ